MGKNPEKGGLGNKPLTTILIDDEASARNTLHILLSEFCPEVKIVGEAASVAAGLQLINEKRPALVFLDIEIIGGTGFDLLERSGSFDFKVIFTTAHEHYALQAIKLSAIDYLLKPLSAQDLKAAVQKVVARLGAQQQPVQVQVEKARILVPTRDYFQVVKISELVRCEAENNYTRLFLKAGKELVVARTLKHFAEVFAGFEFYRIHQSHLINLDFIAFYYPGRGGSVQMEDGSILPVSRDRKQELLARLDVSKQA